MGGQGRIRAYAQVLYTNAASPLWSPEIWPWLYRRRCLVLWNVYWTVYNSWNHGTTIGIRHQVCCIWETRKIQRGLCSRCYRIRTAKHYELGWLPNWNYQALIKTVSKFNNSMSSSSLESRVYTKCYSTDRLWLPNQRFMLGTTASCRLRWGHFTRLAADPRWLVWICQGTVWKVSPWGFIPDRALRWTCNTLHNSKNNWTSSLW